MTLRPRWIDAAPPETPWVCILCDEFFVEWEQLDAHCNEQHPWLQEALTVKPGSTRIKRDAYGNPFGAETLEHAQSKLNGPTKG
eukprot:g7411.t1